MRRALVLLLLGIVALVVLPPLGFRLAGEPPPALPEGDRRISVGDGVSVNAVVKGQGRPVVLVHGLPGCGLDWQPLTDLLARRGHRVIAYDRVGYGHSDARKNGEFTPDGSARDLLGLLESEGLEDATVVGWSYGGATAIRAARTDPTRIGRIVLVGSAGPWPEAPAPPWFSKILFSKPVLGWAAAVPPVGRAVQAGFSDQAFHPEPVAEGWLPQLAANFASPHTMETYQAEGSTFGWGDDLDPSSIDLPVLVIHGDQDQLVPLLVAERLHELAPRSQLLVIEDAGHMLPVTRAEELAKPIAAFALVR